MPNLTVDLSELGLPIEDASGWIEAVDSLGNTIPVVHGSSGSLAFAARALEFDDAGVAEIDLPSTDDLGPDGVRYRAYLTRTDAITQPTAVGPFVFTETASLGELAVLPPADVVSAMRALRDEGERAVAEERTRVESIRDEILAGMGQYAKVSNAAALQPVWDSLVDPATRTDVVLVTDSIGEGVGAGSWANRLPVALQANLRALHPIAGAQGPGYVPVANYAGLTVPGLTITGTPVKVDTYGLGSKAYALTDDDLATYTFTGTRVRVWYGWNVDFETANGEVRIDGGAWSTMTADPDPGSGQFWESPVLTAGAHTVEVRGTTGLPFILEAFDAFGSAQDRTAGVHVYDGTHSQWISGQFLPSYAPDGVPVGQRYWQVVDQIKPVLTIAAVGTNDWAWNVPPATLRANLQGIAARAGAAADGAPHAVLLVIPYTAGRSDADFADEWAAYRTTLAALAGGTVAVLDMQAFWPYVDPAAPTANGVMTDFLHPNVEGHKLQASILTTALQQPVPLNQLAPSALVTAKAAEVEANRAFVEQRVVQQLATVDNQTAELIRLPSETQTELHNTFAQLSMIDVRLFGAVGDGVADDTAAIQAAIDAVLAATPLSVRLQRKPTLHLPRGVYRITAPLAAIVGRGIRVVGDGSLNTAIIYDSDIDAPIFDIGTFSSTPADIFAGTQGAEFRGIRIQRDGGSAGSRIGQGVRASGGGSLVLDDVVVHGLKYGVNSPYGGDFNNFKDILAEFCDVGVYQGPGGQQFIATNVNTYLCREGVVLDRPGHAYFGMPVFNSPGMAGLVIESTSPTSTRQLTSFGAGGVTEQSKVVLDTPWFESNAGGLGDDYIPDYFVKVNGNSGDAYRDIEIRDPYIVAGSTGSRSVPAFLGNVGAIAAQRVRVARPVFQGTMAYWFHDPGNASRVTDPRTRTGYTAPALANTYTADLELQDGNKRRVSAWPAVETIERTDGTVGTQVSWAGDIVRFAFLNAGSYLTRFGIDVQNRRVILDDPSSSTACVITRSPAMPTSGSYGIGSFVHNTAPSVAGGKVLLGWKRLTSGAGHVNGTDWTPVYATTS